MSVYVDDMYAGYGQMKMCHMLADSRAELDAMADKIGVQCKWIQRAGTYREHYDVCMSKRALAIEHGAIEVGWREIAAQLKERREKLHVGQHSLDCDECHMFRKNLTAPPTCAQKEPQDDKFLDR